jgi:hypothetical protein
MYKDFDEMLAELGVNHETFADKLNECDISAVKLLAVLVEMEKGVVRDYKLKEGLIVKQ